MDPDNSAELWDSAQHAVIAGDVSTLERLLRDNPTLFADEHPPAYVPSGPGPTYAQRDARAIIAREQHFETYAEFVAHVEARKLEDSSVARFESAVEAVINGDAATLERLLREHPELVHARSTRQHRSTLLHYVGANGIEGFRQKTPKNAVDITRILVDAGADVNEVAEMYGGGSTTLGLVATSVHPWLAGVQMPLLELLLARGATIEEPGAGSAVHACLANGRGEAAEFLAERGARLDLAGAAGVGRLDLVAQMVATATAQQLKSAFEWACGYGRTSVVEFLLRHGMAVDATLSHNGLLGLHMAAVGAHVDTVKLLLERKFPVDRKDGVHGGTPLGWALYGWFESEGRRGNYHEVVRLLVAAGAPVNPKWIDEQDRDHFERRVHADPNMLAALRGGVQT